MYQVRLNDVWIDVDPEKARQIFRGTTFWVPGLRTRVSGSDVLEDLPIDTIVYLGPENLLFRRVA